jgi:curved DNA-binding protein CbpA
VSHARFRDLDGHDPYELLGVDRTADADEIARGYRRQIQLVHPDRLGGDEDAAKRLHVAREVLLDAQLRQEYDLSTAAAAGEPVVEAAPKRRTTRYVYVPRRTADNMTMSVIAMFVFFPLAIPAVLFASKARDAIRAGDHEAATTAVRYSRFFSTVALLVGSAVLGAFCCMCLFLSALAPPVVT